MKHIVMQHHLIKKHEISCTWAGEGEQSDSGSGISPFQRDANGS